MRFLQMEYILLISAGYTCVLLEHPSKKVEQFFGVSRHSAISQSYQLQTLRICLDLFFLLFKIMPVI